MNRSHLLIARAFLVAASTFVLAGGAACGSRDDAPDTGVVIGPDGLPIFPAYSYGNADGSDPAWIGDYVAHREEGEAIIIDAEDGARLRIVVCEPGLIRVVYAPHGEFEPDVSYSVIRFDWTPGDHAVVDRADELVISTAELFVRVRKRPLRVDFFDRDARLLSRDHKGVGARGDAEGYEHPLFSRRVDDDESLYGLGERVATQLRLNGTSIENWNRDVYNADTGMQYKSHSLYYSTRGYGVFVDNPSRMTFEIDNAAFPDQLEADGHAGEMDWYFVYGPAFRGILTRYTKLTGTAYLPPKWALGYQQCRWAYETQARVEEVAAEFRRRDIPCDAIWLDGPTRGWWRAGVNFEPAFDARYPDPPAMIDTLGAQGFELALLVNHTMDVVAPAYAEGLDRGYYVRNTDGSVFLSSQWNGACATVDFTQPGAGQWYAGLFDPLLDMGVAAFWIDMGDGGWPEGLDGYYDRVFHDGPGRLVHNPQGGLLDAKVLHEHVEATSGRRPFVMTRSGFPGQQRYAWTWSADLRFDAWSDMLAQLRMEQSMGLMGVVYGSDIGGSSGTLGGNGESYVRWLQMEVFNFFTRSHVDGSEDKEPWAYGPAAEAAAAKWLRFKYAMLPYIYTAAWEMSETGVPLHRPLVFDYPNDREVHERADEFLFGDWFLVAPVVHGDAAGNTDTSRDVYLPAGRWIDYRDGRTVYEGPTTLRNYPAPLEDVPIFVRAGAIVPMEDWTEYVGERPLDLVTLDVYPWGSSAAARYEDDGDTLAFRDGAFAVTRFECEESGGSPRPPEMTSGAVTLTIRAREGDFTPPERDYLVVMHGRTSRPAEVRLGAAPLGETTRDALLSGGAGWAWDADSETLTARFADTGRELRLEVP